jgi:hypothetical protein
MRLRDGTGLEHVLTARSAVEGSMLRLHRIVPVALALATLAVAPACASHRYHRYPSARADDRGYYRGYNDGRAHGERDARRGQRYDYERHRQFRSGHNDYGGYGSRGGYQRDYRRGFVAGYDEGYRRYARYDRDDRRHGPDVYRSWPGTGYASPASQNGYRDGYAQGRDDGRDGDRYDPVRGSRYREGDHDYDRRYGPRDDYKRDYRAAFQQGYDQGYREFRDR